MAQLKIETTKNEGSGFFSILRSEGLLAKINFDPLTGEAQVTFEQADNMASALGAVVDTLLHEARTRGTNPAFNLRIDIDAGKFAQSLRQVAPRFGFSHQQRAGEYGMVEQYKRFRLEIPLKADLPLAA